MLMTVDLLWWWLWSRELISLMAADPVATFAVAESVSVLLVVSALTFPTFPPTEPTDMVWSREGGQEKVCECVLKFF